MKNTIPRNGNASTATSFIDAPSFPRIFPPKALGDTPKFGMASKNIAVKVEKDSEVPGLLVLTFNRPDQLNSFIFEQYHEVVEGLKQASEDDEIVAVLLRGTGKFFTSGHDLRVQSSLLKTSDDIPTAIEKSLKATASALLEALINFRKPIMAGVNGKALGIGVTLLGLCDFVYCAQSATFRTPFMELGFCAEGCSSATFPALMGTSKANELLLLGREIDAQVAKECNLVAQVFPDSEFESRLFALARALASLPPQALRDTKELVRGPNREKLLEVNDRELTKLKERFMSEEAMTAIAKFMMSKKKKSPPSRL